MGSQQQSRGARVVESFAQLYPSSPVQIVKGGTKTIPLSTIADYLRGGWYVDDATAEYRRRLLRHVTGDILTHLIDQSSRAKITRKDGKVTSDTTAYVDALKAAMHWVVAVGRPLDEVQHSSRSKADEKLFMSYWEPLIDLAPTMVCRMLIQSAYSACDLLACGEPLDESGYKVSGVYCPLYVVQGLLIAPIHVATSRVSRQPSNYEMQQLWDEHTAIGGTPKKFTAFVAEKRACEVRTAQRWVKDWEKSKVSP